MRLRFVHRAMATSVLASCTSVLGGVLLLFGTSACGGREQLPSGQRYAEPESLEGFCWGPYRAEVDGRAQPVNDTRLAVQFIAPQRITIHFDTSQSTAVSLSVQAPSDRDLSSRLLDLAAMPDGWVAEFEALARPDMTTVATVSSDRDPMEGQALVLATSERLSLTVCAWGKDTGRDVELRAYGRASL